MQSTSPPVWCRGCGPTNQLPSASTPAAAERATPPQRRQPPAWRTRSPSAPSACGPTAPPGAGPTGHKSGGSRWRCEARESGKRRSPKSYMPPAGKKYAKGPLLSRGKSRGPFLQFGEKCPYQSENRMGIQQPISQKPAICRIMPPRWGFGACRQYRHPPPPERNRGDSTRPAPRRHIPPRTHSRA